MADAERELEWLRRVRDIAHRLSSETDLEALLPQILDHALDLTGAERGFVVRVRAESGGISLKVLVARGFNQQRLLETASEVSRGAVQRVLTSEPDGLVTSSHETPELLERSSVKARKVLSILCVPMRVRGSLVGVLYLDHRFAADRFTADDLPFLRTFGEQAALALETAEHLAGALAEDLQPTHPASGGFVEVSPVMRALSEEIDRAARSWRPALLVGERGAGKHTVAGEIHARSARCGEPMLQVSCAGRNLESLSSELFGHRKGAFPWASADRRGAFVLAGKGTLYLDEVETLPLACQVQLRDVLREGAVVEAGARKPRKVHCRVIVGAEVDLREAMERGEFRKDLYYELDVLRLIVPPLRQRGADVPALIEGYAAARGGRLKLTKSALDLLTAYAWPGNLTELRNEVERLVERADEKPVTPELLSPEIAGGEGVGGGVNFGKTLGEVEREMVQAALEACGGNKARAARQLGVPRSSFYALLDRHGLR